MAVYRGIGKFNWRGRLGEDLPALVSVKVDIGPVFPVVDSGATITSPTYTVPLFESKATADISATPRLKFSSALMLTI